jgi:hypothetical protein
MEREMNEAPTNQSGVGDTFASQSTPQSNPFTADLKGEFTSNFGTNTNAVSQIFKEGGYAGNNRTKYIIIAVVAVLVIAIGAIFLMDDGSSPSEDSTASESGEEEGTAEDQEGSSDDEEETEQTAQDEEGATEQDQQAADQKEESDQTASGSATDSGSASQAVSSTPSYSGGAASSSYSEPISSGPISLAEPANNAQIPYDESVGAPTFSWSGGSGWVLFSRSPNMQPVTKRARASGNSYAFRVPHPGTWYWAVKNNSGMSEVRQFTVQAPARRAIQVAEPQSGGTVAGNGGTVSWQGDAKVAFYRVEISNSGWAAPQYRYATSGNSVQLSGVAPGAYEMRVGAFSEVAGRWEYSSPVSVTVQ